MKPMVRSRSISTRWVRVTPGRKLSFMSNSDQQNHSPAALPQARGTAPFSAMLAAKQGYATLIQNPEEECHAGRDEARRLDAAGDRRAGVGGFGAIGRLRRGHAKARGRTARLLGHLDLGGRAARRHLQE